MGSCITIGAGTDYEIDVPVRLLPTIDQVYGGAPGCSPVVMDAFNRQRADRRALAEETMSMFEDTLEGGNDAFTNTQNIL